MSKQRESQMRNHEKGLCYFCASPISPHSICLCERHMEAARVRYRLAHGSRGWRPGGQGRPPNSVRGR